mgnify:CR=1 FL=1
MRLVTFVFTSNLTPGVEVSVKGSTMRNAMLWAATRLGVKPCNVVFLRIEQVAA